ncbi:MAG: hypothetical protein ABI162_18130 [Luteolibacter sp.]
MMPPLPGALLFTSFVITGITAAFGVETAPDPSILQEGAGKAPIFAGDFRVGLAGGKFAANLPGVPRTEKCVLSARAETEIVMDFLLLDIRYEHIETELAELENFRYFLDIREAIGQDIYLVGGVGYSHQSSVLKINEESLGLQGEEILLNCEIQAEWNPVIVTASYVHCLDRSTKAEFRSDIHKSREINIGSLEARLEYRFSPTLGSSISIETQLNSNTVIEKQYLIAIELTRSF